MIFISIFYKFISICWGLFFTVITYIQKLKEKKCDCSDNWKRMALNIFAMIAIIAMILEFIVLISIYLISNNNIKIK